MSNSEKVSMMHVKNLRVEGFETKSGLAGYVTFQAMSNFKISSLQVKLFIQAETNLAVGKNDPMYQEQNELKETRSCFFSDASVRERQHIIEEAKNVQFEEGDYGRFRFSFYRSYLLPSSFEHQHARVRYTAYAILEVDGFDSACAGGDLETSNLIELAQDRAEMGERLKLEKVYLKIEEDLEENSRLEVTATAGTNGYLVGEKIPLRVRVRNSGNYDVRKIEMVLLQNVKVKTHHLEQVFDEVVAESSLFPSLGKREALYEHFLVIPDDHRIPDVAGPSKASHEIMEIDYFLQMRVFTSSARKPSIESTPFKILLGTHRPTRATLENEARRYTLTCEDILHQQSDNVFKFEEGASLEEHLAKIFKIPMNRNNDNKDKKMNILLDCWK